eukprot:5353443-Prymnesium_polylepis.2
MAVALPSIPELCAKLLDARAVARLLFSGPCDIETELRRDRRVADALRLTCVVSSGRGTVVQQSNPPVACTIVAHD